MSARDNEIRRVVAELEVQVTEAEASIAVLKALLADDEVPGEENSADTELPLWSLGDCVKDSSDRARIDDTLASLQAVRSAMEAERAPGGAGLEQAEVVCSRLASFESSLQALGASIRE